MCVTTVTSINELQKLIAGSPEQCLRVEHNAFFDPAAIILDQARSLHSQTTTEQRPANTVIICADDDATHRYLCLLAELCAEDATDAGNAVDATNADNTRNADDAEDVRYAKTALPAPCNMPEAGLQILSVNEFCIQILNALDAETLFGRRARLLSENEYDILIEDMKVSGLKAHRIREILKFFQKRISENSHHQDDFLLSAEERLLYKMLQENLLARRAMLSCELPVLALAALEQSPQALADDLRIFATDFGTYSLASQQLIEHVAKNRLTVCGSTNLSLNSAEPYAHLDGFINFAARHPQSISIKLDTPLPQVSEQVVAYADAEAEIAGTAAKVAALVGGRRAPADIAIAVPNDLYGEKIAARLADAGIAYVRTQANTKIRGDIRNAEKSGLIKLDAFMKLLADEDDTLALRTWMSIGDWLAASDTFAELMAYAAENELTVQLAIADLYTMPASERPLKLFGKLTAALTELDSLMTQLSHLPCAEAIVLLEDHGMRLAPKAYSCLIANPFQPAIAALYEQSLTPTQPCATDAVRIVPFSRCHGLHRPVVFITGLVGGFLPALDALSDDCSKEHRDTMLARGHALYDDLRTMATSELVCSYFESESLELATKLKLDTTRIYVKDGRRRARVARSPYLTTNVNNADKTRK